jgi:hypothetical protein
LRIKSALNGLEAPAIGTKVLAAVAAIYVLGALVHAPATDAQLSGLPHVRIGSLALAPPAVLSGDSPHYLVIVNSIIEDWDLDLANNYGAAAAGGWQTGARYRGVALDRHTEVDTAGRELSFHSIFLPLLLSVVAWPFRGTAWVEPVCISLTLAAVLISLALFARRSGLAAHWMAVLAIATPLWCYSRDIWTEPWLAAIWIGLLFSQSLPVIFLLALVGTLIKYNFVLIPVSMAVVFWFKGERRRAGVLAAAGILGIVIAIGTVQYLFRDMDHFNLFHLGGHNRSTATLGQAIVPLRFQLTGLVGMLLDPEAGLLPFFPFLAWGFWQLRKGGYVFLPVIVFLIVNGTYPGWRGGAGFSSRYLVPIVPALIVAVARAKPKGYVFLLALAYGALWGILAGVFPAIAYDRTPVQSVTLIVGHLAKLAGL